MSVCGKKDLTSFNLNESPFLQKEVQKTKLKTEETSS